jgi:hypothetical protein
LIPKFDGLLGGIGAELGDMQIHNLVQSLGFIHVPGVDFDAPGPNGAHNCFRQLAGMQVNGAGSG